MQKTLLTMVVVALAFATFPPTTTAAETEFITTISTGDPTASTDHQQECHDQLALLALDVPGCTFEDDVRNGFFMTIGFLSVNAGNTGVIPLTGDVTADLQSDSGREVVFTCTWNSGAFGGCRIDSLTGWPGIGEGFTFDCYSAAGALGNWGECFVLH